MTEPLALSVRFLRMSFWTPPIPHPCESSATHWHTKTHARAMHTRDTIRAKHIRPTQDLADLAPEVASSMAQLLALEPAVVADLGLVFQV
jgi:hypothetical protein